MGQLSERCERREALADLRNRAFEANDQAKVAAGPERETRYREKALAISYLLEAGCAFVNSVDWSQSDPTLGVTFIDGGRLHTKLSSLSSRALRCVRRQLNGGPVPDRAAVARTCRNWRSRRAA